MTFQILRGTFANKNDAGQMMKTYQAELLPLALFNNVSQLGLTASHRFQFITEAEPKRVKPAASYIISATKHESHGAASTNIILEMYTFTRFTQGDAYIYW